MKEMQNKIKEYFKELQFDAQKHSYEVRGKPLTSVSKTISKYVEKVDFDKIAGFVAKKRGITKAEVLAMWAAKRDNSCSQGTTVHSFGENYFKGKQPTNGFEEAIVKFWDNLPPHIIVVAFELKMYSEAMGIAGTADIVLYNLLTGKFIIADYKTNEDLFKNFKGKTLLAPFNHLLDMPFSKHEIQLSMYQVMLQQFGIEVESRKIIWLRPNGMYYVYEARDLSQQILIELIKK